MCIHSSHNTRKFQMDRSGLASFWNQSLQMIISDQKRIHMYWISLWSLWAFKNFLGERMELGAEASLSLER